MAFIGTTISIAPILGLNISIFRLTLRLFKDERTAFYSSLFFVLQPANIFMTSIYTESLYSALTFFGLLSFFKSPSNDALSWKLLAAALFSLSALTRSNGVLNAGFFMFDSLHFLCSAKSKKQVYLTISICSGFPKGVNLENFEFAGKWFMCPVDPLVLLGISVLWEHGILFRLKRFSSLVLKQSNLFFRSI